jgi:murein DD-endopeptidase MepM/ murein hydrolase activator NlpD
MGKIWRKYIIVISVFCCFGSAGVFGQVGIPAFIYESMNDSIDLANEFYSVYDSGSLFLPATELYDNWDNDYLHYPSVDFSKKTDTTLVRLVGGDLGKFSMPRLGYVTSEYGWRRRRFHYGIDLQLNIGDSVKAAFDGVVRVTRYHQGYGNIIVVRHFNGLETFYAHLSVSRVYENQPVKAGEFIGFGGSTGWSTGPHLHFETRYMGKPFNPRKIIDFEKHTLKSDTMMVCAALFDLRAVAKTVNVAANNGNNYSNSGATYHIIRKGQTLSHVAAIYHTTVTRLCQLNGLTSRSILQIGQRIRVR